MMEDEKIQTNFDIYKYKYTTRNNALQGVIYLTSKLNGTPKRSEEELIIANIHILLLIIDDIGRL